MRLRKQIYLVIVLLTGVVFAQEVGSGNNVDFGGNSSRIVYENIYQDLEIPFSLSSWVLLPENAPSNRQYFFASCWPEDKIYSGFWVSIGPDSFNVAYGDGNGALAPSFRRSKTVNFSGDIRGNWVYVTFVVEGSTDMRLYLNGIELDGSYSGSGEENMVNVADGKSQIGFISNNNGDLFFNGKLDELRVWNYAQTQIEVRQSMASKLDGNESGLIGYWRFDEGAGSTAEEGISNEIGNIEGNITWELSGAPLGDESFFEYFPAGTKKKQFINNTDSFWISSESDNWVGYHVYKVNEAPNFETGSTIDLLEGYYGIFPIFEGGESAEFRVDFGNYECTVGNFRHGNSDETWEDVITRSDSSRYFTSTEIVEFIFENNGSIEPIGTQFFLCVGESVIIDATSDCATAYNWFNTSSDPQIEIFNSGEYWIERTTVSGVIREDFTVKVEEIKSDFLAKDFYFVCESEFPLSLLSTLDQDLMWSTGETASFISVDTRGIYWAEYASECGVFRDSVFVEIIEVETDFLSENFYAVCQTELPVSITSSLDQSLTWSTGEVARYISVSSKGVYWAEYTSECGVLRDTVYVEILSFETDFLSEDQYTICYSDLPFSITPSLIGNLSWSTGEFAKTISIDSSGIYWAEYESGCGIVRDSVFVKILDLNDIFIPNVITPNDDDLNECFIIDDQLIGSDLVVFNRAGVEVYRSTSYKNNWCPIDISSGVYFYQISNTCYQESFKGWLSVLK